MAVEAIRGKLSKGEAINLIPPDAPAIELTPPGEAGGGYVDAMVNLSEARFVTAILCHRNWVEPEYGDALLTYILGTDDAQAQALLRHHVLQLVKVPVFASWTPYLWTAGRQARLVTAIPSGGGMDAYRVVLDRAAWTELIAGSVEAQSLHFKEEDNMHKEGTGNGKG
jgi:hypothetical protein